MHGVGRASARCAAEWPTAVAAVVLDLSTQTGSLYVLDFSLASDVSVSSSVGSNRGMDMTTPEYSCRWPAAHVWRPHCTYVCRVPPRWHMAHLAPCVASSPTSTCQIRK